MAQRRHWPAQMLQHMQPDNGVIAMRQKQSFILDIALHHV